MIPFFLEGAPLLRQYDGARSQDSRWNTVMLYKGAEDEADRCLATKMKRVTVHGRSMPGARGYGARAKRGRIVRRDGISAAGGKETQRNPIITAFEGQAVDPRSTADTSPETGQQQAQATSIGGLLERRHPLRGAR